MDYRTVIQIRPCLISAGPIAVMLLGLSFSQMSHAQERTIVYEFAGDLIFYMTEGCDLDFPALNESSFHWVGTFDADATRVAVFGIVDRFAGDISLTLQGPSNLSGTHDPITNTIGEYSDGVGGNDSFMFTNEAEFVVSDGGFTWTLNFTHVGVPPGFTGAVSPTNTLTPFVPSDVNSHGLFLATYSAPEGDTECIYGITNGVASGTIGSTESVFEDGFEDLQ